MFQGVNPYVRKFLLVMGPGGRDYGSLPLAWISSEPLEIPCYLVDGFLRCIPVSLEAQAAGLCGDGAVFIGIIVAVESIRVFANVLEGFFMVLIRLRLDVEPSDLREFAAHAFLDI